MAGRKPESDLPRTVAELRPARKQPERWEFIAGAPVMMAPGSLRAYGREAGHWALSRQELAGSACRAATEAESRLRGEYLALTSRGAKS